MAYEPMSRSTYKTYIVDDGWNLPYEVVEEITFMMVESQSKAFKRLYEQKKQHKGDWLTEEVAYDYACRSLALRALSGNQYIGKLRELGEELQERYGVTELEAINILFERNVDDYVQKYYRIKNLILPAEDRDEKTEDEMFRYYLAM